MTTQSSSPPVDGVNLSFVPGLLLSRAFDGSYLTMMILPDESNESSLSSSASVDLPDAPLDLRDAPVDLRDAPVDLRDAPVDLRDAPVDLRDAALDLCDAPPIMRARLM